MSKELKKGTLVAVWRDNGKVFITTTRSEVENLQGRMVVQVAGISGCYALDAFRPITEKDIHPVAAIPFAAMFNGE